MFGVGHSIRGTGVSWSLSRPTFEWLITTHPGRDSLRPVRCQLPANCRPHPARFEASHTNSYSIVARTLALT
jgi:hypothetical protein